MTTLLFRFSLFYGLLALLTVAARSQVLVPPSVDEPVRIACVGDSITFGAGTDIKGLESYPAQLQRMLGERALVGNFGLSGATLLNAGNRPYQEQGVFRKALAFDPDVVIILLGTNDTKSNNWIHKGKFVEDYESLIAQFAGLESKPEIILGLPVAVFGEGNYGIVESGVLEEIPMIEGIAAKHGFGVIDFHATLAARAEWVPDRVHPNADGYHLLAKTVYKKLTGEGFSGVMPEVKTSEWNGFVREDFESGGRSALLVLPKKAAPGNPWIWRTEFFGHFPWADQALLKEGWTVAYIDMQNLFGSPPAMAVMDDFYAEMTAERGLNPKVVLEGFSRGGLYAFNWAARSPEKVASIYGDAPVLDIKSWPGGKGVGNESTKNWQLCLEVYGLTEEEALVYDGNPVDNLKPLADADIPILIVAGDSDLTVPIEENVLVAQKRYEALGGRIEVILKPGIGHHPHSLEAPQPIVDFLNRYRPLASE